MRAPAALTVLGDTVVGAIWSNRSVSRRRLALPLASVLLYWSGMVFNDFADRKRDAIERPERPIPSGRVSAESALALGTGLAAAGFATATAAGGRHGLAAAGRIAGCVVVYDFVAKDTPAGPLVMAGCRFLDVMLGATPHYRSALIPASVMGLHTTAITVLSQSEVSGSQPSLPVAVAIMAGGVAAAAMATARPAALPWHRAAPAAGVYAWSFGPSLWAAWQRPSAERIRASVRAGIASTIAVQAMLAARSQRSVAMYALCVLAIRVRLGVSAPTPTEVT
nr:UbiA family prenyltransferase [Mycobacterium stomatepiae]